MPKDEKRAYDPLKYRKEQALTHLDEHLDAVGDRLEEADAFLLEGRIGEAKEVLKKMHSSAGSCLSAIVYAQAMEWASKHPHIRIDRGEGEPNVG